jgi:hypothetical protein
VISPQQGREIAILAETTFYAEARAREMQTLGNSYHASAITAGGASHSVFSRLDAKEAPPLPSPNLSQSLQSIAREQNVTHCGEAFATVQGQILVVHVLFVTANKIRAPAYFMYISVRNSASTNDNGDCTSGPTAAHTSRPNGR